MSSLEDVVVTDLATLAEAKPGNAPIAKEDGYPFFVHDALVGYSVSSIGRRKKGCIGQGKKSLTGRCMRSHISFPRTEYPGMHQ